MSGEAQGTETGTEKKARKKRRKSDAPRREVVRITSRKWAAQMGPEYTRALEAMGPDFAKEMTDLLLTKRDNEVLEDKLATARETVTALEKRVAEAADVTKTYEANVKKLNELVATMKRLGEQKSLVPSPEPKAGFAPEDGKRV